MRRNLMSVPALSLILFPLLCAGLFTRAGRTRVPLTAPVFLLLAGTLPALAEPQEIYSCTMLGSAFEQGGDYILAEGFETPCSIDLSVPSYSTVTLDLNGQTIDRGLKDKDPIDNGCVILVNGKLTLTGSGTVKGGNTTGDGGGVYVESGGTFTMGEGITITGNSAERGGGVYNGGTFNMDGGTISVNTATSTICGGGGVYNYGTFTMKDGTISDNTAIVYGGGVCNTKTFTMEAGTITGNTAFDIGGVDCSGGTFNLSGGEVTGNKATGPDGKASGGGIVYRDPSDLHISGNPVVTGNTAKGKASNVYSSRSDGNPFTIAGKLTEGASMGILMYDPGVFTSGLKNNGDDSYFFSDDPDYYVEIVQESGEATLTKKSGERADKPVIDPAGGVFTGSVEVTITTDTENASIYYTTDGKTVTKESTLYTEPFTVSESCTVSAIAVRRDLYDSDPASAEFTITEASYTLTVDDVSFGEAAWGYEQPAAQALSIKNSGNTAAAIVSAELSGGADSAFEITAGTASVAAGGTNTSWSVRPKAGLAAKDYSEQVIVTYDIGTKAADDLPAAEADVSFTVKQAEQTLTVTQEGAAAGETLPEPQFERPKGIHTVSLSYSGTLADGTAYDASPAAPTEPGTYTVTVRVETENVIYTGTASFTITPSDEPEPEPEPEQRLTFFRICEDCMLPATGFSSVRPTALSEQPEALRYEPVRMRLMLPTLEQDLELVTVPREGNSWAVDWLGADAGILAGSAVPGEGISVIAAHNTLNDTQYGPFALLASMEPGDRIFVRTAEGELLSYAVYANEKIAAANLESLEHIAGMYENSLTLVTCEDEMAEGGYASRRVVAARICH